MRLDAEARITNFPGLVFGLLPDGGDSGVGKSPWTWLNLPKRLSETLCMFTMGKAIFRTVSRSLSETVPFRTPTREIPMPRMRILSSSEQEAFDLLELSLSHAAARKVAGR